MERKSSLSAGRLLPLALGARLLGFSLQDGQAWLSGITDGG